MQLSELEAHQHKRDRTPWELSYRAFVSTRHQLAFGFFVRPLQIFEVYLLYGHAELLVSASIQKI